MTNKQFHSITRKITPKKKYWQRAPIRLPWCRNVYLNKTMMSSSVFAVCTCGKLYPELCILKKLRLLAIRSQFSVQKTHMRTQVKMASSNHLTKENWSLYATTLSIHNSGPNFIELLNSWICAYCAYFPFHSAANRKHTKRYANPLVLTVWKCMT